MKKTWLNWLDTPNYYGDEMVGVGGPGQTIGIYVCVVVVGALAASCWWISS